MKKTLLDESKINEFNSRYEAWKQCRSNPASKTNGSFRSYTRFQEYSDLIVYCSKEGKNILPLILEKLNSEDFFAILPLEDLAYKGNENLMETIHNENYKSLYTKEGVFVIYTIKGNWLQFGKKLLANFDNYQGFNFSLKEESNLTISNNEMVIENYPNPFNPVTQIKYFIPVANRFSIKIYDVVGREISTILDNEIQTAGWHQTQWKGTDCNGNSVSSGIYFCRILSNSKMQTIKLLLMR
jgi:hypothetical protein